MIDIKMVRAKMMMLSGCLMVPFYD